tara:strand:- start:3839 stop:4759 length:921 start_codon:yes stop_codon:yes gene_type:complete
MSSAIKIKKLSKVYPNNVEALKGIDLDIQKNDFFGLLGPNGAGKTTTIGILTGLVKPTSGDAYIFGNHIIENYKQARQLIGLSPQEINLDVFFTIEQLLIFQAGYYGIDNSKAKKRAQQVLSDLGIKEKANETSRHLSGGMKRRVLIAKALIHSPPILILDEPTAGVDIELRYMLWDLLKDLNSKGTTILLTTHYIEEAEYLCNKIAIINNGKIITSSSKEELLLKEGKSKINIKLDSDISNLNLNPWEYSIKENQIKIFSNHPDKDLPKIINIITSKKASIIEINIDRNKLEDIFIKLTQNNNND